MENTTNKSTTLENCEKYNEWHEHRVLWEGGREALESVCDYNPEACLLAATLDLDLVVQCGDWRGLQR